MFRKEASRSSGTFLLLVVRPLSFPIIPPSAYISGDALRFWLESREFTLSSRLVEGLPKPLNMLPNIGAIIG